MAPSKKPQITLDDAFGAPPAEAVTEQEPLAEEPVVEQEPVKPEAPLVRIRVLMTSPEPILTAAGESLALEAGDVHFVDHDSAEWLIDSGVAEAASL